MRREKCVAEGAAESHPDLLDTVRADRLSFYGYPRPTTPNLDRLAEESLVFSDCLAQSTATAASHMSLFTGQYVHRHGLAHNSQSVFPRTTLASGLRDQGWRTAAFTGHGSLQSKLGHGVGFDVFESEPGTNRDGKQRASRNLREVVPRALEWIDAHAQGAFFLFVHGYDPHCPYSPPEPWSHELVGSYSGALDLTQACGMWDFGPWIESGALGEAELRHLSDLYDAEVAAADAALGEFLDALKARHLLDRSILVFTSDHGEVLGDHDWVGHTRLWEEELRVPLLIRFPEGRWAGRLDDPVQHIDLMPTLLAALGIELPPGVQGIDLMPRIRGEVEPLPAERMRLSEVAKLSTVRFGGRWKIANGPDERNVARHQPQGPQIYDLDEDPGEGSNLYGTPQGRRRFEEIWRRYREWRQQTRDDDVRFRGTRRPMPESDEHLKMLETLGYVKPEEK